MHTASRQALSEVTRYAHGFVVMTRFLLGGPLVALPPEPAPEPRDAVHHAWMVVALALLITAGAFSVADDYLRDPRTKVPFYVSLLR